MKTKTIVPMCAFACLSLLGAEAPSYGISLGGLKPTGRLSEAFGTSSIGFEAGCFVHQNLNGKQALRLGVAWGWSDDRSDPGNPATQALPQGHKVGGRIIMSSLRMGLDYLYFLNRPGEGPYVMAGAGAMAFRSRSEVQRLKPTSLPPQTRPTAPSHPVALAPPHAPFDPRHPSITTAAPWDPSYEVQSATIAETGIKFQHSLGVGWVFSRSVGAGLRWNGLRAMGQTLAIYSLSIDCRF